MADTEKVVIQLVLEKKDFNKSLNTLAKDAKIVGKKAGKSFGESFSEAVNRINKSKLGRTFDFLQKKVLSLKSAVLGVFAGFTAGRAIKEASNLESRLTGLTSVANRFGIGFERINKEAQELASDGLVPLEDITESLKNLLISTNGDLEQSVKSFKAFREVASFNRQGTLELGEAISRTTQGIRNQISTLTDNIGTTENLSSINEKYAKSIGKTVNQLTEQEKKLASTLGLTKEALKFTGDFEKSQATFSGTIGKLTTNFNFLLVALGKIVTKSPQVIAIISTISDKIKETTKDVENINKSDISTFFDKLIAGSFASLNVINKLVAGLRVLGNVVKIAIGGLSFLTGSFVRGLAGIFLEIPSIVAKIAKQITKIILDQISFIPESLKKTLLSSFDGFTEPLDNVTNKIQGQLEGVAEGLKQSFNDLKVSFNDLTSDESSQQLDAFFDKYLEKLNQVIEAQARLSNETKKTVPPIKGQEKAVVDFSKTINQAIAQSAVKGIQALTRSLVLGEKGFRNFGKQIAGILGDLSTQLGQTLILTGVGMLALGGEGSFSPTQAIVAGAGLVALGTILKSFSGGQGGGAETAGGAIQDSASSSFETDVEREEPSTEVTVNISGDVLDSDETGSRIVNILNEAYDKQGVVINRGILG